MRVRLPSFGRPSKPQHSDELQRSSEFHRENTDNCRPKKIERQGFVSCRSIAINAWITSQ